MLDINQQLTTNTNTAVTSCCCSPLTLLGPVAAAVVFNDPLGLRWTTTNNQQPPPTTNIFSNHRCHQQWLPTGQGFSPSDPLPIFESFTPASNNSPRQASETTRSLCATMMVVVRDHIPGSTRFSHPCISLMAIARSLHRQHWAMATRRVVALVVLGDGGLGWQGQDLPGKSRGRFRSTHAHAWAHAWGVFS